MSSGHYLSGHGTRATSQAEPIPGSDQLANSAGGFTWAVDAWTRLRRFLILGSEGGSYYAGQRDLTRDNIGALRECLELDHGRTVDEIVEISTAGRAPKNDQAIFALAYASAHGTPEERAAALDRLTDVCRTGTHLFQFVTFVEGFRGWGRQLRRAVARWYTSKPADQVAYQAIKYRQRDGVTHRDVLRLAHPAGTVSAGNPTLEVSEEHREIFRWIAGQVGAPGSRSRLPMIAGFESAQRASTTAETAALVREYGLPREALNPDHLTSPEVWEALLEKMPMTALIRNLATMTRVELLTPGSAGTKHVLAQLGDADRIRKARLHPIAVLAALRTYAAGQGVRGQHSWSPVVQVVDALDAAFYTAFGNVEPSGKRFLLALDISGSMGFGVIAGIPGLTPRDASAAMALVTAATEQPDYEILGFSHTLTPLAISPRQRLDDAIHVVSGLPFGATDCALPMLHAASMGREVDVFVVYTDSETWYGSVHPAQALQQYREQTGIDARLAVVGMVANRFSIADPNDAGMLDICGFDTATPQLLSEFAAGRV